MRRLASPEMKTPRIFSTIPYLVLWLSVSSAQFRNNNLCEDGWQYFTEFGGASMCFRAITTPLPWKQAQEYCQRDIAHLVNADPISRFYPFSEVDDTLPQYIFKETNGEFWSGMHVKNGRLMWDAYGPEFAKNSFIKSWIWSTSQPSLPDAEACGHVVQGRRIIPEPPFDGSGSGELPTTETPPTTTVREEYNGQNSMNLSVCTDALPFVCQKPTTQYVDSVSYCPDGWLGSLYIPYCFRIIKDPLPHEDAKKACQGTYGGEMIQATPNSFNVTLSTYVLKYYLVNDTYFQNTSVPTVWIDGGPVNNEGVSEPDQCYTVKEGVGFQISTDQCVNPQPFICVRPTVRQEKINYEVTSPFLSQKDLRSAKAFTQFPIKAIFSRSPNANEIIFIKTPTRYINSSLGYSHIAERFPEKLSFKYNITVYDQSGSQPYEVQLWLPDYVSNNQFVRRKRREAKFSPRRLRQWKTLHTKASNRADTTRSKYSSVKDNHNRQFMIQLLTDFMQNKHKSKRTHKKNKRHKFDKLRENTQQIPGTHYRSNGMKIDSNQEGLLDSDRIESSLKRYIDLNNHKQRSRLNRNRNHKDHLRRLYERKNHKETRRDRTLSTDHHRRATTGDLSPRVKRGLTFNDGIDGLPDLINEAGSEIFVDFNQLYFTTGYYSFGVYTINPPSYVESSPVLVRFSEQDWFIYVITVDVISTSQYFQPESITSFNLYNDDDYIGMLNEFANAAMRRTPIVNVNNGENIPKFIRAYRAVPESFSGNTIKFRAFMKVFGSRSFGSEMEQTMLLVVQEHWKDNLPFNIFASSSLNVRSTVACPTEKITINGEVITFPSTPSGETAFSWDRCIGGGGAFASRSCHGGYDNGVTWGEIVPATGCEAFPTLPESPSTSDLKNLSEVILNATNFNQVLNDTIRLTAPDVNLTEADIIYTAEILYNFWNFEVAQPTILDDIYEIANNVLERIPEIINAAQTITNAANRIIESVEEITSNADLLGMKSLRVIKRFLATNIWDQDGVETPIIGLKFHAENDDNDDDDTLDNMDLINVETANDTDPNITDTAIYLDPELFKGRSTRAVYQIYSRTTLFEKENSRFELISKVAAARLEVDNILITDLGNNSVVVIFRPSKDDDRTVCAFWDYRADEGAGGWATDGCNKTLMNDKRVMCQCNHLTNFAVLIDLKAYTISDTDKLILEIVTKVGLIISIIGLGLTLLTFIIFKHLRSGRGQQVLINLAVSMICSAIIFLVGMDRTETVVGCKVVAALLHYFILVSFMWMLVEGILQYLRFVKVLGTYIPNFMLKTMIPAWGIPIIPVVIVAAIDHDLYYGGNGYCWLARDAMLYGFIIPVAIILFANVIVYCLVMVNLLRRRSNSMKSNQSERKMAFLHFQAAVSIFVVLGLTWVFGFLAIDGARIVFHYIFAILNAFQGFFIFLLFTVREKQIRKAWRKLCYKDKAGKLGSSSTGTDVPRRVTRSSDVTHSTTTSKSSNGNSENGHHKRNIEFNNIGYEPN